MMSKISIVDLFKDQEVVEKNDGKYKTECPCCGLQGGRTKGFILFPEGNRAYCQSSFKNFSILEAYAMKKGLIKCIDGKSTGEKRKVLDGGLFKETLDTLKEEYDDEMYKKVLKIAKVKEKLKLPNDGKTISKFASELSDRTQKENIFFYRPDLKQIVEIFKFKDIDESFEYKGFSGLSPVRFITLIERYFTPYDVVHLKGGEELDIIKSMSQTTAKIVLESDQFRDTMPVIKRMFSVPIPIIHKGELTFPKIGYDERFGSYLPHSSPWIEFDNMPLEEAKKILDEIYGGFCFKDRQDYVNSIAALLTPFLRGLFSDFCVRTPVYFYMANRERSGKDYNAGITGIVYEGAAIEEPPISNNERSGACSEETRKKILSLLIQGRKRFHSSNNKGLINNAVFESYTTATSISDRILGKNDSPTFANEIDYSLSGNIGTTMTPDMANRSLYINLFLEIEDANKRTFDNPNLHEWVRENRNLVLSAMYALVKNWFNKKCPDGSVPFASYPEWARICGGIMEAAGYISPCNKSKESFGVALDTETEDMKSLFEFCFKASPDTWLKKNEIKQLIIESKDDLFVDVDWDKSSDKIKFGKVVDRFVGRILSDIQFLVKDNTIRGSRREYKFVKVKATFRDTYTKKKSNLNVKAGIGGIVGIANDTVRNSHTYIEKYKSSKHPTNYTNPTKEKSDRQIQFTEAKECENITTKCEKDKVEAWIKSNPKKTTAELYEEFGVGSLKYKNELKAEGKI